MASTSLLHQGNPLAIASHQLQLLDNPKFANFDEKLKSAHLSELTSGVLEILQVNVGKLCNMTCSHCHVDAGPDRREIMTRPTVDACLKFLRDNESIHTVDLTGGAPEMNPEFRYFVREIRALNRHVIDRCNLTILLANGYLDMPEFLAENEVEIVASLPCYLEENTDAQRGSGAFSKSVEALQRLNKLGYGLPDTGLRLTLVYNPVGNNLPPDQTKLEAAYREQLLERFGIEFTRLFAITNMPISRFLDDLVRAEKYETYMQTLIDAFNPAAVSGLMCQNTISVDWQGALYDCDFNQMLELGLRGRPTIQNVNIADLQSRKIITAQHCFGCTAGSGSGCRGAIDK